MASSRSKAARGTAPADAEKHPYVLLADIPGVGPRGKIKDLTTDQAEQHKGSVRKAKPRDLSIAGKSR